MTGDILRILLLVLQLGFLALLYIVLMRFAGSLLRDLRSAEQALTKSSSTKIVLLTLRPIELIGPSAIVAPAGGSSAGDSSTERRPIPEREAICASSALRRSRSSDPAKRMQDEVEERHEAELEDQQQDPQDVAGHARTWNSISVSPIADHVAGAERDLADRLAVHGRPVAAAEIGEAVRAVLELQLAVVAADHRVVDDDVVVAGAPDPDERAAEVELDRPAAARADQQVRPARRVGRARRLAGRSKTIVSELAGIGSASRSRSPRSSTTLAATRISPRRVSSSDRISTRGRATSV